MSGRSVEISEASEGRYTLRARWAPILTGAPKRRAEAMIDAIAVALDPYHASDSPEDASLGSGVPGEALFFTYLHLARPGQGHAERARELLATAAALPPHRLTHSVFLGTAGLAWTIEHLAPRLFPFAEEGWSQELDTYLAGLVDGADRSDNWDLVKGLGGSSVYLAEASRPATETALAAFVDYFARTTEEGPDGTRTWRFPPEAFYFLAEREDHPEGVYNLTVAHGVGGILGVLANAHAVDPAGARPLLEDGLAWLLRHELSGDCTSMFPMSYGPREAPPTEQKARLAWCRGDLGIAATLAGVSSVISDPEWLRTAHRVASKAALRRQPEAGIFDLSLCHGAAGAGLLFARLYQRTGDPALLEASRYWYDELLSLFDDRFPETGGVWSNQHEHGTHGAHIQRPERGFLLGAAGVGLALLAAVGDVEPAWDRILLASFAREPGAAGPPSRPGDGG